MTSSSAPPSVSCNTAMIQSFTSELSWKVSMDGGGAFGGERMLLCCILFRIAPLFISQSINQALLQVSKNIFIYRHELVLSFFIWERKTFLYIPHKHNFILYSGTESLFCHFSDNIFQLLSCFLPAAQASLMVLCFFPASTKADKTCSGIPLYNTTHLNTCCFRLCCAWDNDWLGSQALYAFSTF